MSKPLHEYSLIDLSWFDNSLYWLSISWAIWDCFYWYFLLSVYFSLLPHGIRMAFTWRTKFWMVTGIPDFPLWVGKVSLQNRQILEQLSADWARWGSLANACWWSVFAAWTMLSRTLYYPGVPWCMYAFIAIKTANVNINILITVPAETGYLHTSFPSNVSWMPQHGNLKISGNTWLVCTAQGDRRSTQNQKRFLVLPCMLSGKAPVKKTGWKAGIAPMQELFPCWGKDWLDPAGEGLLPQDTEPW